MNPEQQQAFINDGTIPSFFMGPNDTTVNAMVAYALGDKGADMVMVSAHGIDGNKHKKKLLYRYVQRKHYQLNNRTTDNFGMFIPSKLYEVASHDIEVEKRNLSASRLNEWKDPIYLCLEGPDKYDDPFLLRRFRGETYCWNKKRSMWCRAFGGVEDPTEHRPEIARVLGAYQPGGNQVVKCGEGN